jgi:TldD protein
MRILILFCSVLLTISIRVNGQDKLIEILSQEINREMSILKNQVTPVYYLSYRVDDINTRSISTSFGSITNSNHSKTRLLTITLRVGKPELDNFHPLRGNYASMNINTDFPLTDDSLAIKQMLWLATNDAYQQAVNNFTKVKTNIAVKTEEEDKSPDFILSSPNIYTDPPINLSTLVFDSVQWVERLKKYSGRFLSDSSIFDGSSSFHLYAERKYFVSSTGDKIAQNRTAAHVYISGIIKASDGMELPLTSAYFASTPARLENDAKMSRDADELVKNLVTLKNAPVAEPFSGPALLSGKAASVFFHEIFGHRIEGQRMRNENDAQTFKKKVNEPVLPSHFSVYSDPRQAVFNNTDLNGYYLFDDEGSAGKKVKVVEGGILKDFLMSRTPINKFLYSNGHGRAQAGKQPTARQSNLIVTTSQPLSDKQLREELIKLIKVQNKPYGYLFQEVIGGFTQTSRFNPNAFNVIPTLVYRIYADGRPDEMVRGVDLIGTPLSMFAQIDKAGDHPEVFNGTCGAESGGVPVSAVSPEILVKTIETQKKMKSQERSFILPRP